MSLKQKLQDYIRTRKEVSYQELVEFVDNLNEQEDRHNKMRTAERRLNKSESPMIKTFYKNGYITSYAYEEKESELSPSPVRQATPGNRQECLFKVSCLR